MKIEIRNLTTMRVDAKLLEKAAKEVLQKIKLPKKGVPESISVVLMGPREAQKLNMQYRQKSYIPNVLSFEYGPPRQQAGRGSPFLGGEIVLCPWQIRHDAKKYGILFKQELVRIFTHGLLHVLGYNHKQIEKLARTI